MSTSFIIILGLSFLPSSPVDSIEDDQSNGRQHPGYAQRSHAGEQWQ